MLSGCSSIPWRPASSAICWGSKLGEAIAVAIWSKQCSNPPGEMISRILHGPSPAFQNVCHWSRGLKTRSPASACTTSSPSNASIRPSRTKLYSSSRECLCSGATSPRGGIGCSTSENPPPVSSVQAMNRTPADPMSTSFPSAGPIFRGPSEPSRRPAVVGWDVRDICGPLINCCNTIVRESTSRPTGLSRFTHTHEESNTALRTTGLSQTQASAVGAGDAPADHPGGSGAASDRWSRALEREGDRRASRCRPRDRLPPFPRRAGAVRRLHQPLLPAPSDAQPRALGRDHEPERAPAHSTRRALRLVRRNGADAARRDPRHRTPTRWIARGLPRLLQGCPRGAHDRTPRTQAPPRARIRRHRPRNQLPHLALAHARATTERTRSDNPDHGNGAGGSPPDPRAVPANREHNPAHTHMSISDGLTSRDGSLPESRSCFAGTTSAVERRRPFTRNARKGGRHDRLSRASERQHDRRSRARSGRN